MSGRLRPSSLHHQSQGRLWVPGPPTQEPFLPYPCLQPSFPCCSHWLSPSFGCSCSLSLSDFSSATEGLYLLFWPGSSSKAPSSPPHSRSPWSEGRERNWPKVMSIKTVSGKKYHNPTECSLSSRGSIPQWGLLPSDLCPEQCWIQIWVQEWELHRENWSGWQNVMCLDAAPSIRACSEAVCGTRS